MSIRDQTLFQSSESLAKHVANEMLTAVPLTYAYMWCCGDLNRGFNESGIVESIKSGALVVGVSMAGSYVRTMVPQLTIFK